MSDSDIKKWIGSVTAGLSIVLAGQICCFIWFISSEHATVSQIKEWKNETAPQHNELWYAYLYERKNVK